MMTRIGIGIVGLAVTVALCSTPARAQVEIETAALKKRDSPEAGSWYLRFARPAVADTTERPVSFFAKTRGVKPSKRGIFKDDPDGPGSTVALLNQASPAGQAFRSFGNPAMNASGDVAFQAQLIGGNRGVFRGNATTAALLGDSVPGVSGHLDYFSHVVITDGGYVIFRGTLVEATQVDGVNINEGVFRCGGGDGNCSSGTGSLEALVLRNDAVPDRPGRKLCRIRGVRASNFGIAFLAETKEDCSDDSGSVTNGIFRLPFGGSVVTLALEGEPCEPITDPGGTTYGLIRTTPDIANDGSVAFRARTSGILFNQALYLCRAATCPANEAEVAVIYGDVDPRGNVFRFLGEPVVRNGGDLAFKAIARGNSGRVTGVYVRRANGVLQALALQGDMIPNLLPATEFRKMLTKAFSPVEMSAGGKIAFKAKASRVNPPRMSLEGIFLVEYGAEPPPTTTTVIGTTTTLAPTTTTTVVGTTTTTGPSTTTTTLGGCSPTCCDKEWLSFETGIPTGIGGVVRNFRCDIASSSACADSSDCDFGSCFVTPPFCSGNFSIFCTSTSDCQGTCAEVVAGNLPLDLEKGGLYTGGGLNSVPLPFPVPDQGLSYTHVDVCNPSTGVLTLGESTPSDLVDIVVGCTTGAEEQCGRHCTQGRTCTGGTKDGLHCVLASDCPGGTCTDNCVFGPPLPIPNSGTPATSVCTKNVIDIDASGTAECDGGESDLVTPLRSVIYLNGDLFKASTPPDIPGVQPCPLCDTLCQGGTKVDFPCDDNTECPGSSCGTSTVCLGGPNDGNPCTPATSDSVTLGDAQGAYPTSHDCENDPLANITDNIGGLPIGFSLTTETIEWNAVDRPNGPRVFCGFCRDVTGAGSLAFEGDTAGGLPAAIPPADGNAVPCTSDADCAADGDEYESCVQRDPGAFGEAAATRITVTGAAPGECLGDGVPLATELVSLFCVPPTFDATVDAAGDLPGPGGALLSGDAQLE